MSKATKNKKRKTAISTEFNRKPSHKDGLIHMPQKPHKHVRGKDMR